MSGAAMGEPVKRPTRGDYIPPRVDPARESRDRTRRPHIVPKGGGPASVTPRLKARPGGSRLRIGDYPGRALQPMPLDDVFGDVAQLPVRVLADTAQRVECLLLAQVVLPHHDAQSHTDAPVAVPREGQLADLGGQVVDNSQDVAEQAVGAAVDRKTAIGQCKWIDPFCRHPANSHEVWVGIAVTTRIRGIHFIRASTTGGPGAPADLRVTGKAGTSAAVDRDCINSLVRPGIRRPHDDTRRAVGHDRVPPQPVVHRRGGATER
jgi:hypothetical protein